MKSLAVLSLVTLSAVAQAQTFSTNFDQITNADASNGGALANVGSFASATTAGQAGAQAFGPDRVLTLANLGGPTPGGTLSLSFNLAIAPATISYDFWASSDAKVGAGTGVLLTLTGPGGSANVTENGLGASLISNPGLNVGNPPSVPNAGINHTGSFAGSGAGTYTLTFSNLAGNNGMRLDDVTVVATPVPEAQTIAMMLAGLGVLGFVGARRRRLPAA